MAEQGVAEMVFDQLNDGVVVASADDLVVRYANPAACTLLCAPDLVGTGLLDLVHPEDLDRAALGLSLRADPRVDAIDLRGRTPATRFRARTGDGREVGVELSFTTLDDGSIVITFRPQALYRVLDEALCILASGGAIREALECVAAGYAHPYLASEVGIAFDGIDGQRECVGPLPRRLAGVLDDGSDDADDPDTPWAIAIRTGEPFVARTLDGLPSELRSTAEARGHASCIALPVPDPSGARAACMVVWSADSLDIENHLFLLRERPTDLVRLALQRRAQEWQIEHAAAHDPLTNLLNRRAFLTTLAAARPAFAVLYVDLDGFKDVNDRHGHALGDQVLTVTADRIRTVVRAGDRTSRFGGDEFAILAIGIDNDEEAAVLARRLIEAISAPIVVGGERVHVGASVGLALEAGPRRHRTDEQLLRAADRALYAAKASGRGRWELATATGS